MSHLIGRYEFQREKAKQPVSGVGTLPLGYAQLTNTKFSLGSGATGAGGGAVRTSSIFCAPTLLAGGAEAGGVTAPDTVFTGSNVFGLGWATAVTGALDGGLLA